MPNHIEFNFNNNNEKSYNPNFFEKLVWKISELGKKIMRLKLSNMMMSSGKIPQQIYKIIIYSKFL